MVRCYDSLQKLSRCLRHLWEQAAASLVTTATGAFFLPLPVHVVDGSPSEFHTSAFPIRLLEGVTVETSRLDPAPKFAPLFRHCQAISLLTSVIPICYRSSITVNKEAQTMTDQDTVTLSLRLPGDLAEGLRSLAEFDRRSLNGQIVYLLSRAIASPSRRRRLSK